MKGWIKLNIKLAETENQLVELAVEVLKNYDVIPTNITIIQSGGIKTVWKVKTEDRLLCLKRLRQSLEKSLFSVNAQMHIKQSGGNVPAVFVTIDESPLVVYKEQIFVLYEWLEGRDLNFSNPKDLALSIQGLARFHVASKGYKPPGNARISSKLDKQGEQYSSMKEKFVDWKDIATIDSSQPIMSAYLKYVDSMVDIAEQALEFLSNSHYRDLVSEGSSSIVLCHQDYGKGNAILTENDVQILDLDGVTFDLPSRDLRKIIGKQAEIRGQWEPEPITDILEWYTGVNPLSEDEKEVLYIDLLFPHWFFGLVKNLFKNNKALKPSEIEEIAKLEQSKVPMLTSFIKKG